MSKSGRRAILAAEFTIEDTRHLVRSLVPLGLDVYPATTVDQVFERLRHKILREAIVATELMFGDELLIARLGRLPALKSVLAIGPAGDLKAEADARAAGARVYLSRPVTTETLATALQINTPSHRR